ncbi:MAG: hypothetical protein FJY85_16050 [Deltaproteobacteria bacterium]|nr:hypothetical protein [Deltaproteobacteria bacterium]
MDLMVEKQIDEMRKLAAQLEKETPQRHQIEVSLSQEALNLHRLVVQFARSIAQSPDAEQQRSRIDKCFVFALERMGIQETQDNVRRAQGWAKDILQWYLSTRMACA